MGVGYGAQESRDNQTQTHDSSRGILPTLGNWAAANAAAVNLGGSESLFAVGSPRDESSMFQREPHGLSRHGPEGDFY
ncbi:hypothetical protein VKT23_001533 [Stygiomarasmius scandens]|uniref:Uncharacterized protein n=1 Tax=Marasmiellus scandens TaxID=2682957 RepID=A0ABR1JZQ5_9AGAR